MAGERRWISPALEDGANVLYLQGRWRLSHVPGIAAEIDALKLAGDHCVLDGSRLEELDTAAGFLLLRRLAALGCIAGTVEVRSMADGHSRLLTLVRERMAAPSVAAPSAIAGRWSASAGRRSGSGASSRPRSPFSARSRSRSPPRCAGRACFVSRKRCRSSRP